VRWIKDIPPVALRRDAVVYEHHENGLEGMPGTDRDIFSASMEDVSMALHAFDGFALVFTNVRGQVPIGTLLSMLHRNFRKKLIEVKRLQLLQVL